MVDYIKRGDALKAVNGIHEDDLPRNNKIEVCDVLTLVPSADVAPVRHGRWEKNDYLFIDTLYRCSVCGEEFYLEDGTPQENQYYYCPKCGARMDGDDNEID